MEEDRRDSSSSDEDHQIEMVKMDEKPAVTSPQRVMSTTDVAKYDELLSNIRKYKSQHNIPDISGATIQLKNLSFELDVPVGGNVKTMTNSLRPKDHIKSIKSLFKKEEEPKTVAKQILKNVSLTIKPKSMTLLLGPPGSGRSTLLKLIARLAVKGRMTGELLINGQNPHTRAHHHYVSYVTQDDNHHPTFKVYQTAYFASLLLGKPELSSKEKMTRADELLKQLGLDHRRDTIIGNDYIRGLSGGERKRMTIAISMLKESQCLLLDEPTTGLDANTSLELFKYCNAIKDMIPVFATLLQPSAELFFQFDNLVLMDEGRILYAGPTTEALPFFAKSGFVCPDNKNPADFLLEMIDKMRKYKDRPAALSEVNPQLEQFEVYENTNRDIDDELLHRKSYNASFMMQMVVC